MVKSETRRDAEILVRNPSPRLFGEKFRDSKKVKTNHEKTRLRDLSKTLPRSRDRAKIFPRTTFFDVPFATPIIKRKKFNSAIIAVFFFPLSLTLPPFLLTLPFILSFSLAIDCKQLIESTKTAFWLQFR